MTEQEKRERRNARLRERYANDPVYREHVQRRNRDSRKRNPPTDEQSEQKRQYNREYVTRPERREKEQQRRDKPETKAYMKAYGQRPGVKEKQREYQQRPEVKAKRREYNQKPEVKARARETKALKRKEIKVQVKRVGDHWKNRPAGPCVSCPLPDCKINGSRGTLSLKCCLLYTSPSPRDRQKSRMPSSA